MAEILHFNKDEAMSHFNDDKEFVKEVFDHNNIYFNLKKEIEALKKRTDSYGEDEMIDVMDWDGECWKSFFEEICSDLAKAYEEDVWDVIAVMIPMMFGIKDYK